MPVLCSAQRFPPLIAISVQSAPLPLPLMAYPVVCYEAEEPVSIQCYAKAWLDAPLPQPENGIQNGFCVMLWDQDAPLGPHGWPMKYAVLSEVPVPLESRDPIQVGAVRWHRRVDAAPLVLG